MSKKNKKKKVKKNKDIRVLIARPIFLLIAITSILIFMLFNVVLFYSLDNSVCNSLNTTTAAFKQFFNGNINQKKDANFILEEYLRIYEDKISNIDLIIAEDKEIDISSGLTSIQATEIINELSERSRNTVHRIKTPSKQYFYTKIFEIEGKDFVIYVVASIESFKHVIAESNRALLTILVSLTIVSLIMSYATASFVSDPIKKLSKHAEDIGDGILSLININSNCNELIKLENSINLMVNRLSAFNEAQKISLQNLSHELRTPLMSIQGYAEVIKYGYSDNIEDATNIIIEESKRLSTIVDQILILSKLDTLTQEVNILPIDFKKFTSSIVGNLNGYALKENILIKENFVHDEVIISADEKLLCNIIINILSNAIRYAKCEIDININRIDGNAILTITDDGNGLNEDDLKYIFTRFYKGKSGNYGLGMTTAKSAAEYMGGTIVAENAENSGARFTIKFPLAN